MLSTTELLDYLILSNVITNYNLEATSDDYNIQVTMKITDLSRLLEVVIGRDDEHRVIENSPSLSQLHLRYTEKLEQLKCRYPMDHFNCENIFWQKIVNRRHDYPVKLPPESVVMWSKQLLGMSFNRVMVQNTNFYEIPGGGPTIVELTMKLIEFLILAKLYLGFQVEAELRDCDSELAELYRDYQAVYILSK